MKCKPAKYYMERTSYCLWEFKVVVDLIKIEKDSPINRSRTSSWFRSGNLLLKQAELKLDGQWDLAA